MDLFEIDTLHLVIDGNGCNVGTLKDLGGVYRFLDEIPLRIGMTKMMQPYVVKWKDKGSSLEGVTGFVTIAESHISVHTFPDNARVYVDIFSCKHFDKEKVLQIFKEHFEPEKVEFKVIREHEGITP